MSRQQAPCAERLGLRPDIQGRNVLKMVLPCWLLVKHLKMMVVDTNPSCSGGGLTSPPRPPVRLDGAHWPEDKGWQYKPSLLISEHLAALERTQGGLG